MSEGQNRPKKRSFGQQAVKPSQGADAVATNPSMASWFSFSCTKPRNAVRSSLLEENLQEKAKSETLPSWSRIESDESVVSNVSLLSEASTAPGIRDGTPPKRRTSFADQQKQPLEKMCASFFQPITFAVRPSLTLPCPATQILCALARRSRGPDGRGR